MENHYTGFDAKVIQHILSTDYETYTISAHPFMLSLDYKSESKASFINFVHQLTQSGQKIIFETPTEFIQKH